ncbi:FtsX-like permease family protein [Pseudoscardovia suis]|nr:FtsX-like permease family protein [Pseudoscardovia suis]
MKRSRRTLVPAGIAIAIGSLFICATLLLGNVLDSTSTKNFTARFGGAGYSVSLNNPDDAMNVGNDGSLEHTLKNTGMDQVSQVQGVDDTRYSLEQYVHVVSANNTRSLTVFEVSAHHSIMPVELTQGAWPGKAGEAAIDEDAAKSLDVSTGDTLTIDSDFDYSNTESSKSSESSDPSAITITVTGITHDTDDQYSLSGGSLVVTPDDMLALYKQQNVGDDPAADQFTHSDLPASTIYYSVAKGADASKVRDDVSSKLTGAKVQSRSEAADERLREMNGGGINPITAAILAFGVLAMFVAALVIANTFRVLVTQRRRTLALLRTIGASKSQVHRSVLTEGTLLGLEYSAIGTALSCLVVWILDLANVKIAGSPVEFIPSASSILVPIVFATLITLLASTGAARAATMVSPMEALRPIDATEKRSVKAGRAVFSVLLLAAGIGLAAKAITQANHYAQSPSDLAAASSSAQVTPLICAILGAMLSFIGLALSSQVWVPWVLAGLGKLVSLIGGASGTVAAANIRKNPRRVAATSTALLIGVTLVATVATGASCATATVNKMLDSHYTVDASVTTTDQSDSALSTLKAVDGVKNATRIPMYAVQGLKNSDGLAQFYGTAYVVPDSAIGVEVADVFGTKTLKDGTIYVSNTYTNYLSSSTASLTDGQQIDLTFKAAPAENFYLGVYEGTAAWGSSSAAQEPEESEESPSQDGSETESSDSTDSDSASSETHDNSMNAADGLALDDYASLPSADKTLTVQLTDFAITSSAGVPMVMSQSTAKSLGLDSKASEIWLDLDTDQPASDLVDNLTKAADALPQAQLDGSFIMRTLFNRVINIAMFTLFALLSAALLIALVGVANTLSLSVIERQRESATLRAIGMTAGQLRASLAWEAVLISIGAGIVGIIVGAFYGWLGSITLFVGTDVVAAPNWSVYLGVLLLSLVAALLASIAPARRAIKVPPVEALTEAD